MKHLGRSDHAELPYNEVLVYQSHREGSWLHNNAMKRIICVREESNLVRPASEAGALPLSHVSQD